MLEMYMYAREMKKERDLIIEGGFWSLLHTNGCTHTLAHVNLGQSHIDQIWKGRDSLSFQEKILVRLKAAVICGTQAKESGSDTHSNIH